MSEPLRFVNLTDLSAEQAAMEAQFAQFAGKRGAAKIPPGPEAKNLVERLSNGAEYAFIWDSPTHIATLPDEKQATKLASSLTRQMAQLANRTIDGKERGLYRAVAQHVGTGFAIRAYPVAFRGSNAS